ncbi:hypothetical protein BGZ98_000594, partial [Dissophora globulifera]
QQVQQVQLQQQQQQQQQQAQQQQAQLQQQQAQQQQQQQQQVQQQQQQQAQQQQQQQQQLLQQQAAQQQGSPTARSPSIGGMSNSGPPQAQVQPIGSFPSQETTPVSQEPSLVQAADAAQGVESQDKDANGATVAESKDGLGSDAGSTIQTEAAPSTTVGTEGQAKETSADQAAGIPTSTSNPQASAVEHPSTSAVVAAISKAADVAPPPSSGPESTIGFAQAMMAMPVPVITLPSSVPHNHHGPQPHPTPKPLAALAVSDHVETKEETEPAAPPAPPAPMIVAYHPITRAVDTYGGIDILAMEKFVVPHYVPGREYLGAVDIHALIMSLKSGMKLEITNALNTLSTLTRQDSDNLQLVHCPELLDVLLDLTEETFRNWRIGSGLLRINDEQERVEGELEPQTPPEQRQEGIFCHRASFDTYQQLFEASVDEACHLLECKSSSDRDRDSDRDREAASESDSVALSKSSTHTTASEWSSYKDQFLSLSNILRNLSFLPANFGFLARYPRFLRVLQGTLLAFQMRDVPRSLDTVSQAQVSSSAVTSATISESTLEVDQHFMDTDVVEETAPRIGSRDGEWLPPTGALTILEHRKDVLTILANLSGYLILPDSDSAQWIMMLILDFMNAHDTYYASLALEAVAKLGISHDNRMLLSSVDRELRIEGVKQRNGGRLPARPSIQQHYSNHNQKSFLSSSSYSSSQESIEKWEEGGFLLPLFGTLSAMLAKVLTTVTEQPTSTALVMPHSALAHLETLMLAMYNLAVLSEADFRRYMVVQPGFVSGLLRLSVMLADVRTPAFTSASMRTVETLRVVSKDNEDLLVQYTEVIAKAAMQPHIHPKVLDDLMCVL